MDIQTLLPLASSATGLIISYLSKAGEAISKKAGDDLYSAVKARFQHNESFLRSLDKAASETQNREVYDTLERNILAALLTDESFRERVDATLRHVSSEPAGTRIEQHSGDDAIQIGTVGRDAHIRK